MEGNHASVGSAPDTVDVPDQERVKFAALYRANVAEVYRYLHRRCRETAMAEDLTQDVFLSVLRSTRPIDEIGIGFLMTAAQHRLIDMARRQDRYAAKLRLIVGGLDDVELDPESLDRIVIERAMERLSVDHRLVLSLHYLDDLTVAGLAQSLGRSEKSVDGLITRARRNLHRELEQSRD